MKLVIVKQGILYSDLTVGSGMRGYGLGTLGNIGTMQDVGRFTNTMFNSQIEHAHKKAKPTKKKVVKRVKKEANHSQPPQESTKQLEVQNDDIKIFEAEGERKKQFEQVEANRRLLQAHQESEMNRLRDAVMLAEIIGQPRCKVRHGRRPRRG